jgi:hypothetical protein
VTVDAKHEKEATAFIFMKTKTAQKMLESMDLGSDLRYE